jgi:osmotically-inducible protein OsmY
MAQDGWNEDRHGEEPLWGNERRRERPRSRASQDWGPEDYDRYRDDRPRGPQDDDARYRPFGEAGPIATRRGSYSGEGRAYGGAYARSGRYDDLSPNYRAFEAQQRSFHGGDYEADRYTPNPREGRGEESRTWWDRTQDEVSSWFGDDDARRRREWDERRADIKAEHRGRGPKGYKRSDGRIEEDVNDRLTDDPYLDASDIQVSVKDSEVTLSGTIRRREDKRRAEDLAELVSGVAHVQNNLRVKPLDDSAARANVI